MKEPEQEPNPKQWHQQPIVRAILLLLLPIIAGALFLISTRIALQRPAPIPPETSEPEQGATTD